MSTVTAVPLQPLRKGSLLKLWIGILLVVAAAVALAWTSTSAYQIRTTPSGLRYQILAEGEGDLITPADVAYVDYILKINGHVIQTTAGRQPLPLTMDNSGVPGFREAMGMMREGTHMHFWVPPSLGYGRAIPPGAPFGPNDTMDFETRIAQVTRGGAAAQQLQELQQMMEQQQQQQGAGGAGPAGAGAGGAGPAGAGPGGAAPVQEEGGAAGSPAGAGAGGSGGAPHSGAAPRGGH